MRLACPPRQSRNAGRTDAVGRSPLPRGVSLGPRVVELPRWLWWLILNGVILRFRPARSARAYAKIWTDKGSPLLTITAAMSRGIRERLQESLQGHVQCRARHVLRTAVDCVRTRRASRGRRTSDCRPAALPAVLGHDDGLGVRCGHGGLSGGAGCPNFVSSITTTTTPVTSAACPTVSASTGRKTVAARSSCSPSMACRSKRCSTAIPTTASVKRPRGSSPANSVSATKTGRSRSSRASGAPSGFVPTPTRPSRRSDGRDSSA